MRNPFFVLWLTGVAVTALSACKPAPEPVADVRLVRTQTVGASTTSATNIYAGEVRARYETQLGFRVGGKVVQRAVGIGDRVRAGQVLARLDPKDLQLGDAAAQAQVAAAQAQFNVTQNDLERVRGLHAKGYASQGELDRYASQFEAAKAQLEAAKAQRNQIANQASYSTLVAGGNGVITAILAEAGQVVAAGQPVVELALEGEMEVAAAIPEDQVNAVREGMPVTVSLWAADGKTVPGVVREMSAAADPYTRTYSVRVSVPEPPPEMKLRMTASIAIPLENLPDLIHLPAPAMVTAQGKAGVWVVEPKSMTTHFRSIHFAGVEGNEVLVSSGLKTGDIVATAGAAYLSEGQKVRLMNEPLAADATKSADTPAAD